MTLGEHILQYRTARGWSQEDLADALEVSRQSVSKWETGASAPDSAPPAEGLPPHSLP